MDAKKISEHVYAIHADICSTALFEGIWPIPSGVTLNSYVVKSEKTALIDFMRDWEDAPSKLEAQCRSIGVSLHKIDYLILNHLEPDHAGHIRMFKEMNPGVEIIATKKGINLVRNFFKIQDNLREVKTGDTLDLGGGIVLSFMETPNIHWPETMMTYEPSSGTLFSCDAFGSYGATGERIFDDEFDAEEHLLFEKEALRYYANIVASFGAAVKSALEKLKSIPVKVIAPSHGMVWRTHPELAIERCARYAGYNSGGAQEKEICVIWGSMYGNTRAGVTAVIEGIREEGVPVSEMEIPQTDASEVLACAFGSKGLVVAMPTYEYRMFPPMAHMLELFGRKHFTDKIVLRIGSWGWVGGAEKDFKTAVESYKWNMVESCEWQGVPSAEDLAVLKERGRELARQVKVSFR